MSYRVIVNPAAGHGLGKKSVPKIEQLFTRHNLDFDLVCTTHAGEAIELAAQAVREGIDTVVAAGGDGTYHEVVNGMVSASEGRVSSKLGLLPLGSGCDLAWMQGIPFDLEEAVARLARQQTKWMDLGQITVDGVSRYFDNTLGIGFDGIVVYESITFKFLRGLARYLPVVLKTVFLSFKPIRAQITYQDDEVRQLEKTILMATLCNGRREGGGFMIAPQAENDDGVWDLCLADNIPRLSILGIIPLFIQGTHVNRPEVTMLRCRRFEISSQDDMIAHADGEPLCTTGHHIVCEILPQHIEVMC